MTYVYIQAYMYIYLYTYICVCIYIYRSEGVAERRIFFLGVLGLGSGRGSVFPSRSRIPPVGDRFPKSGPNRLEPQKQAKVHLFGLFLQVFCFPHRVVVVFFVRSCMHTLGIEPRSQAWKACMMPRLKLCFGQKALPGKGPQSGCTNWGAWESEKGDIQAGGYLAIVVHCTKAILPSSLWLLGLVA